MVESPAPKASFYPGVAVVAQISQIARVGLLLTLLDELEDAIFSDSTTEAITLTLESFVVLQEGMAFIQPDLLNDIWENRVEAADYSISHVRSVLHRWLIAGDFINAECRTVCTNWIGGMGSSLFCWDLISRVQLEERLRLRLNNVV